MASSSRQTIESVVQNFGGRTLNKAGEVAWFDSHRVVTCNEKTLWYGHSLRAAYLAENLFLKNADQIGSGWNAPSIDIYVRRHLTGPDVSFSALRAALLYFFSEKLEMEADALIAAMTTENIVDWQDRTEPVVYLKPETHRYFERVWEAGASDPVLGEGRLRGWVKPAQGMFVPFQNQHEVPEGLVRGYWHIAEGVLLRIDDKFLLGGLDEGRYFLSLLSQPAQTVTDAYEGLKPAKVREAEQAGREVRRQGEWFFVKSSIDRAGVMRLGNVSRVKEFEKLIRLSPLVGNSRADGNQHVCHHLPINVDGNVVQMATGLVRHQRLNRWTGQRRQTGEHGAVNLGEAWWEVYENTAVRSWSVGGRFD